MIKDITIGRFIDTKSALHKADARTKIIAAVVYSVMLFVCDTYVQMAAVLLLNILAVYISKISVKYILKGLKPLIWFMVFTFAVSLLFGINGNVLWKKYFFTITDESVKNAITVTLRFIFLVTGTSLLTLTTAPLALTDGLARLMKPLKYINVPTDDIAMIISITLRFIPTLSDEAERILKAQKARGGELTKGNMVSKIKAIVPIVIPLFVSVFRHAEELSDAMDSRCYGKGIRKSRKKTHFGKNDVICGIVLMFFCVFSVIIKFCIEI